MSEWIKIEDRLPDEGKKILTVLKSKEGEMYALVARGWFRDEIYSARYDEDGDFVILPHGPIFKPSHWMPMPDLPKE